MKINSYKEMIAYTKAYELAKLIYKETARFPKEEMYGLAAQMRRAAVSIPSNIAEGFMRGTKEYVHFLKIALGSSAELETQISLSKDFCFLGDDGFCCLHGVNEEVMKLLTVYIKKMTDR